MRIVERERELRKLSELLDGCVEGHGGCALVTSLHGCGKTELLNLLGEEAEKRGFQTLSAVGTRPGWNDAGNVLIQLLRNSTMPVDPQWQLTDVPEPADEPVECPAGRGDPDRRQLTSRVTASLSRLTTAVLTAAARRPLLICVDDGQFTDYVSLSWLLMLLRHIRSARVVLVVTACRVTPIDPELHAQLLRQPHHRRIELGPLSVDGVAMLLAEEMPGETAERAAAAFHAAGSGIPFLVRALLSDWRHAGCPDTGAGVTVGEAYVNVVLSWLRNAPPVLRAMQILALLDEEPDPRTVVVRLMPGEAEGRVVVYLRELTSVGFLDGDRLRHTAVRAAVLDTLNLESRCTLHGEIAEVLFRCGVPPIVVSRHLVAAGHTPDLWAVSVLRSAAEWLFACNDFAAAYDCAELALRGAEGSEYQRDLYLLTSRIAWLLNPALGRRYLTELSEGVQGEVPLQHAAFLVRNQLLLGDLDAAVSTYTSVLARAGDEPTMAPGVQLTRELFLSIYPALRPRVQAALRSDRRAPWGQVSGARELQVRGAAALSRSLTRGPDPSTGADAEEVLETVRLAEHTYTGIKAAVVVLALADRLESAAGYAECRLAEARTLGVPIWTAQFAVLRGEIALRQGDLLRARELAAEALTLVPNEGWGAVIGSPLSVMISATTEAGDYDTAAQYLAVPLPDVLYQSRFYLNYLYGRGRYHAATGRLQAALNDFTACGTRMTAWGIDQPSLVPWRSEAAEVHLRLGNRDEARELLRRQACMIRDTQSRTWGLTLRGLAAVGDASASTGLLTEAVDALRASGDRLNLARSLVDLGGAPQQGRQRGGTAAVLRMADRLARECGASPLALPPHEEVTARPVDLAAVLGRDWSGGLEQSVPPGPPPADIPGRGPSRVPLPAPRPAEPPHTASLLSGAERRVAVLAVRGLTNREIAEQLQITTSTVEQHLTRIYRKLAISRRDDLPDELLLETADT